MRSIERTYRGGGGGVLKAAKRFYSEKLRKMETIL
jgi:hypothetical protein